MSATEPLTSSLWFCAAKEQFWAELMTQSVGVGPCSTYGLDATSAAFEVGYECAANSVASTDSFGQPSMTDVKARLDQSALASY